jgi:hypothetical protein
VALQRLRALMDLEISAGSNMEHSELTDNRKLVRAAAADILNVMVKVDENRLRKQQVDYMPQLLAEIAEYDKAEAAKLIVEPLA